MVENPHGLEEAGDPPMKEETTSFLDPVQPGTFKL
jgi:hypothetical protein